MAVPPFEQVVERYYRIAGLRHSGLTLQAIGEEVGLSRERVRQIICIGARRVRDGLSPVARRYPTDPLITTQHQKPYDE